MNPMAPDGIIGTPALSDLVYADSSLLGVKIRANRSAMIRGLRWESGGTELTQTVDANTTPSTTRLDLIVLRLSRNPWTVGIAVVKGTPASSPTTPSPTYGVDTSTGVWELPLAVVTVPYNTATIGAGQCSFVGWYVGEDGQILCTSTNRPPHHPGRVITETDTGRGYVSVGGTWLALFGNVQSAAVATSGTTGATSYVNLTGNVGPTVSMVTGATVMLFWSVLMSNNTANAKTFVDYVVSGATSRSPSDASALRFQSSTANQEIRAGQVMFESGLTPGSNTFTLQYKTNGGTGSFADRRLTVIAL